MFSGVVSASQATALLSELNDKIFWEPRCQRELLFTLRARWPDFTSRQRRAIERRIVKGPTRRSEEHTSELQSLMRNSYAVFCLKKKKYKVMRTIEHKQSLRTHKYTNLRVT